MAQDPPPEDLMHYEQLAQDALRGVVKAALKRAAAPEGLPGAHHFYLTFKTDAPGVSAPKHLLAKYPDDMTIVIKPEQYRDLAPGETFFSIILSFGGQPERLSVPYSAVTRFYDPTVQFRLLFEAPAAAQPEEPPAPPPPSGEASDEPKVVSLDQFRKK
jgi:hypothetical protein